MFLHKVNHSMMKTVSICFLIIGILLVSFGALSQAEEATNTTRSISLPPDPFSFQLGKGQDVANTYCLICHSADYIYMQPKHSEEKWVAIIHKMQQIFGCPIPQAEIPRLAAYLFQQNSTSPLSQSLSR